jgi:hypothetical protein
MTEPDNSGPIADADDAEADGDGWVNGRNWFTTGADGAGSAS